MEDLASCSAAPLIKPGRAARGVESSITVGVDHPGSKIGGLIGLILAAMAIPGMAEGPLPADIPGVKFCWFTAGFAYGLSPEGSILASLTTCCKVEGKKEQIAPSKLKGKR
jgi:hypothetical protein